MSNLVFQANSGGSITLTGTNTASTATITIPATTGNMVTTGDVGTVTSTMLATGAGMVYPGAGIANSTGTAWGTSYTTTGSGTTVALATSPTLVTPVLGVATATSVNKVTLTSPATSATLTIADGSTLATSGAFSQTHTTTAATNVTYPAGTSSNYLISSATQLAANPVTGTPSSSNYLRGDGTWASAGGGKVLQVVQATKSGATYTVLGTYLSSGLFATITPTSSTSKIMMIASSGQVYSQTGGLRLRLYRGTSGEGSGSSIVSDIGFCDIATPNGYVGGTVNWLDSPASTSALTYTIMQKSENSSSLVGFCGGAGGTFCSILLLEIAA